MSRHDRWEGKPSLKIPCSNKRGSLGQVSQSYQTMPREPTTSQSQLISVVINAHGAGIDMTDHSSIRSNEQIFPRFSKTGREECCQSPRACRPNLLRILHGEAGAPSEATYSQQAHIRHSRLCGKYGGLCTEVNGGCFGRQPCASNFTNHTAT